LTNSVCSQQSLIYIERRRPRVDWRSGGRTPADTRQRGSINHVRVLVEMVQAMSVSVERRTEQAVGRAWGGSSGSTPRGSSDLGVVPDSRGRRRCSVTGPPRINHVELHTTSHRQRELELLWYTAKPQTAASHCGHTDSTWRKMTGSQGINDFKLYFKNHSHKFRPRGCVSPSPGRQIRTGLYPVHTSPPCGRCYFWQLPLVIHNDKLNIPACNIGDKKPTV